MTNIVEIKEELNKQLADVETLNTLVITTFKGLTPQLAKRAMLEGMMRGFTFEDFLQKNVYAIPYGKDGYSLVTSIDYARKVGMRSGVVGKTAPIFDEKEGKVISCTVTIKRASKLNLSDQEAYVGEYTATVFFSEYSTGRNLWASKPHTMIAKVAEMHALRMACPEQLSQMYVEEEREVEVMPVEGNYSFYEEKLRAAQNLPDLKIAWDSLPGPAKGKLLKLKEEMKGKLENPVIEAEVEEPPVDMELAEKNIQQAQSVIDPADVPF